MTEIPTYTFTWEDDTKMTIPFMLPKQGKLRGRYLTAFAEYLKYFDEKIGFKLSARGWCYQLEGFGLIDKGQFNRVQKTINECRKKGLIDIRFVAEEKARNFSGVEIPETRSPEEYFKAWLDEALNCEKYFTPDWWEGEEYYIQMLVEKIDLVTLFEPVCKQFHIPIATSKGWSSILQRAEMLERFKAAEEIGLKSVLLYCGDFDPYGLAISDYMRKNLNDLYRAMKYDADNLTIDRFGLNYDFIEEHGLSWIENLITGSGKQPNLNDPIVWDYVQKYGQRKCEANALVVEPEGARQLCQDAIEQYLGVGAYERFEDKFQIISDEIQDVVNSTGLRETVDKIFEEREKA